MTHVRAGAAGCGYLAGTLGGTPARDFAPSPRALAWLATLRAFLHGYVLPHNAAWQGAAARGEVPAFLADLKALARPGSQVVVMSNGGFGGLHGKLAKALD